MMLYLLNYRNAEYNALQMCAPKLWYRIHSTQSTVQILQVTQANDLQIDQQRLSGEKQLWANQNTFDCSSLVARCSRSLKAKQIRFWLYFSML